MVATSTNDDGITTSATSAHTATVLDALPTITTPEITGDVREGETLTASASSGQEDNDVTYQWQLDGNDISGATGATLAFTDGDEGHTIDVVASTTNDNGVATSATSADTASVLDALPTITTPEVSGEAREGETLTASASSGQEDNDVTYQWQLDGNDISGATGATYTATEGDEGHQIDVVATATNDNGVTTSATSVDSASVLDALPTITTPEVSGEAREGDTLTASASSGQDDNDVTYQWQLDGNDIAGATGATYTATEGDEGHTIDVVATATNDDGVTTSATSGTTDAVLDQLPNIDSVTITGTAEEDQTLTAVVTGTDPDHQTTYQWLIDGEGISGATGATYTVTEGDEGHEISVVATSTNDNEVATATVSQPTDPVLDAPTGPRGGLGSRSAGDGARG